MSRRRRRWTGDDWFTLAFVAVGVIASVMTLLWIVGLLDYTGQ